MGFRRIVVHLFLQLRLQFASGPFCQSLGRLFLQGLCSQISKYLVALSLQNMVNDLFSGVVIIGGAGDDSVDGCINGRNDGPGRSIKFALNAI